MDKKPNILLIMADQLRFDSLGFAGNEEILTPYLNTLASDGIVFDKAYSAVPSCIGGRCALMTGLKPKHHGRVGYEDNVRWDYNKTLAGELAKNGYYTKCVGKMHVHPIRKTLGFHDIDLHDGYLRSARLANIRADENQKVADDYYHELKTTYSIDTDSTYSGLDCNSFLTREWEYKEKLHPTNWVTDKTIDFLRKRDKDMPFFLMASYLKPHPPFNPPKEYYDLYRYKKLSSPIIGDWEGNAYKTMPFKFDGSFMVDTPELIHQMKAGYYGCISHLDRQIGRIIMALHEYQLEKDTIILFVSDHGEELGDHHYFKKGRPYEGSCHIPFMISNLRPLGLENLKNTHDSTLLELRDIMPTILEMAGCKCDKIDGKSVLPVLRGEKTKLHDYLHGEHAYGKDSAHWIISKDEKYIWFTENGKEQFFNLSKDPYECHNEKDNPRIKKLRATLINELKDREEGFSDGERLIPGRPYHPTLSFLKDEK